MSRLAQLTGIGKDTDNLFLFADNGARADLEIQALSNRRARIAENLEKFRKAVEIFFAIGDLDDVISFVSCSPETFRRDCISRYMQRSKIPKEVDFETFYASLSANPPEVEKVIQAHAAAREPLSQDPRQYVKNGEFHFLPLSITDKDMIRERAKDFVRDEETATAYRHVKTVCTLFNRLAPEHRSKKDPFHDLPGHLKPYINCTGADPMQIIGLQNPAIFTPRHELFIIKTEAKSFKCFDE